MKHNSIIATAKNTIEVEAAAIRELAAFINDDFANAVNKIATSTGRLVVSGIGKSAIIAQKIVATLNSTGTPALFMHAADAVHGDLGMIQKDDVIIIISKSGDSPEIKVLAPLIKSFGNTLIAIVGNTASFLAKQCDIVLNTTVSQEACPNNLAPTTSTTAQMVMGDALAVCLMEVKGFGTADFARFHPGGMLGKKLYLRVADLSAQNEQPAVTGNATINEVIVEITRRRLGATAVVNSDNSIAGIITDGDLRRMLEKTTDFSVLQAHDIMSANPAVIDAARLAAHALEMMKTRDISQLLVVENGLYAGIIHLHDLIREGII
ncbi:MAG: D-arabinose 5-phosphate isomerase [Ferruginibacter sp.]|jgi:arabinose-5-phosphate isomerase|uniref:KpsF/GutQ family sugar-phosphate isomerase n=1 Tax=Ferruginibacter sp. TaxID=1940288 RepID=UPI0026584284|nr:KpsF/GutQ family sugar-phosphate isomerase [Ferruginibacter sp.]MDB5275563.1 D-arabinose 5-phosphate isomerase [Ferruginibacter sp.]